MSTRALRTFSFFHNAVTQRIADGLGRVGVTTVSSMFDFMSLHQNGRQRIKSIADLENWLNDFGASSPKKRIGMMGADAAVDILKLSKVLEQVGILEPVVVPIVPNRPDRASRRRNFLPKGIAAQ